MRALAEAPMFRLMEYVLQTVVPEILSGFIFCIFVYSFSFYFVDHLAPKGSGSFKRRKLCYPMTNFFTNLLLGTTGFYYNFCLNSDPTPKELVQMAEGQFFGTFQIDYQLWAIPVGLLLVQEDPLMLLHHVAVFFSFLNDCLLYQRHALLGTFFAGMCRGQQRSFGCHECIQR